MSNWPSIAIVGAGMGGLATAAALHRRGIGVTVYEQARTSRANTWLRGKTDVDWVYGYNPWTAPLAA